MAHGGLKESQRMAGGVLKEVGGEAIVRSKGGVKEVQRWNMLEEGTKEE